MKWKIYTVSATTKNELLLKSKEERKSSIQHRLDASISPDQRAHQRYTSRTFSKAHYPLSEFIEMLYSMLSSLKRISECK